MWPLQDKAHIHLLGDCCRSHLWLSKLKTSESLSTVQYTLILWACASVSLWTYSILHHRYSHPFPSRTPFKAEKAKISCRRHCLCHPAFYPSSLNQCVLECTVSLLFFHMKKSPISVHLPKIISLSWWHFTHFLKVPGGRIAFLWFYQKHWLPLTRTLKVKETTVSFSDFVHFSAFNTRLPGFPKRKDPMLSCVSLGLIKLQLIF